MIFNKNKGKFGYLKSGKIQALIITLVLFALSISVYFIGYSVTGTNANLFSIIAVLGVLPAAKSLVSLVMFAKAKSCPAETHDKILEANYPGEVLYDLQITAYERAYQVDAAFVTGHSVIGVSSDKKLKYADLEKHIRNMFMQNGHKEYTIKIFEDTDKFIARMKVAAQQGAEDANPEIYQLLKDLAL